ncbi:hypothetical protein H6A02_01750 [Veillonella magna]|uniref:hypothetical protein n=1 Tax=Veillonella magna TaxID=464322 RepID=UPI0019618920|nr:hypothetical protein [Veillonella magna]MBM6823710.1 hypothetical protein [Veillonella magna]
MKIRYVGQSFGVDSLTDGKVYECIGIEEPFLRVIDDSEEDYVYLINHPCDLNSSASGKWEIVEDDEEGSLQKAIEKWAPMTMKDMSELVWGK